jgi:hypothetical protein
MKLRQCFSSSRRWTNWASCFVRRIASYVFPSYRLGLHFRLFFGYGHFAVLLVTLTLILLRKAVYTGGLV